MQLQKIYKEFTGELGRYQILVLCLIFTIRVPSAIHNIGYVFFARTPQHSCSFNRNFNLNLTSDDWKQLSVPRNEETSRWNQCHLYNWNRYVHNMTSGEVNRTLQMLKGGASYEAESKYKCDHWDYDRSKDVQDSLVTEWDLVCDRKWMKPMMATIYALGWMLGSPVTGYFSDRYGRRPLLQITGTMTVILGIINPFMTNYVAFLLVRFFLSAFLNGATAVAFTIAVEVVGTSKRSLVSNLFMIIWAVGYMMLAGVAYLLRTRFVFMIVAAAPTVLMLIPLWFVPESIAWLACKGKKEEANKQLRKMARMNRETLPADIEVTVGKEDTASTSFLDLVRTVNMRKTTFILCFNWFTDAVLFYAINWNSGGLHGNLYVNVFLTGFVEIPSYIVNIFILQYLGRRLSMSGCTFLAGLALLATIVVPKDMGPLLVALTLTSKFFITMAFTTAYQYTTELYPTVIRALGLNVSNFAARFGVLVASYLPLMATDAFKQLPQLVCGIFALVAAISLLFLPETLGQHLPATPKEAEELHHKYKLRDVFKIPKKPHSTAAPPMNESAKPLKTLQAEEEGNQDQAQV